MVDLCCPLQADATPLHCALPGSDAFSNGWPAYATDQLFDLYFTDALEHLSELAASMASLCLFKGSAKRNGQAWIVVL